jgi:polyisoprenoid-binding protein YceI
MHPSVQRRARWCEGARSRALTLLLAAVAPALVVAGHVAQAADSWRINPARTAIRFEVPSSVWGTTRGAFREFEGRLSLDFDQPARSSVVFTVKAASMTTGSSGVDAYIKSDVLFDVATFPTMSFTSRKVEKIDSRTASVTGDLTLRGVTRPLTLRVDVERKTATQVALFNARGTVKRSEFNMDAGVPVVSDDVTFTVVAEASTQ